MSESVDELTERDAPKDARKEKWFASDRAERALYLLVGAIAIGLVFWKLQFTTKAICCGDYDPYYHIRWSQLLWDGLRAGHFPPKFIWLPLTTLNPHDYDDHHLLFHILQIPFTWFGNIQLGAKIAATLFASLALFSCYWLIVRYRIKHTLVWLIALLACSAPFLYRMSMGKAMSLSIVLLVAGIYLLFERKYVWLAPLMFLYVWTYSQWVTLGVATVAWAGVIWWSEEHLEWRPVVWASVGVVAGYVLNPYFPNDVRLFVEHLLIKLKPGKFSTDVGQEWYPYETWYFLKSCLVAFTAMFVGYLAFRATDRKASQRSLFFLILSTVLLILAARYRRSVEYWPPFAVLFAAFTLQPLFDNARRHPSVGQLPDDVLDELQPFFDLNAPPASVEKTSWRARWDSSKEMILTGVVILALGGVLFANLKATLREIKNNNGPDHFQAGMNWINANVPPGEMIFNNNWDFFPKMFFYDQKHTYASGLDPTYLLDKNPDLAKLYDQIRLGKEKDPGPLIRDRFHARWVFTEFDDFYSNAVDSGWFDEVYKDDECAVLHIRDEKGAPLPDDEDSNDQNNSGSDDTDDGA